MIQILLPNPDKGRNRAAYAMFLRNVNSFRAIGIEFVTHGTGDFTFIGPEDFANRRLNLDDSVNWGLDNIKKIRGSNKSIIDSSDSTSLMGSIEILANSPEIKYLFKNQLLADREEYFNPTPHGKWWWGNDVTGYAIPNKYISLFGRIKLTGWNLGYHDPAYSIFENVNGLKDYDICAILQTQHDENYDFGIRNDNYYTQHRDNAVGAFTKSKLYVATGKLPYDEYIQTLKNSHAGISPYGMGEICFRDFEFMKYKVAMIKPSMSKIETYPNPYIDDVTFLAVDPTSLGWENAINKYIEFRDGGKLENLVTNFRKEYRRQYTISNIIQHWHNFFLTQEGIATNTDYGY